MKLKLFVLLSAICLGNYSHAQSNFPYERDWGTYVGGSGTYLGEFSLIGTSLFKDSQNNIHVAGQTTFESGYSASYFNQFVSGGGNPVMLTGPSNYYSAKFSSTGQMLRGDYNGHINTFERIVGIDAQDNVYTLKHIPGQVANLATPGVWLTQNTDTAGNLTRILTKRDSNNNIIWITYLPNNDHNESLSVRFDSNQNIYLLGYTQYDIPGLGTPGVFQENFLPYSISGIQQNNSYLVKLNSSGQKLWGTYSTSEIFDFKFYNSELYLVSHYNTLMPGNFTNPGTFQPDPPAQNIIMKWNANTGKKVWGTFYGTPISTMYTGSGISAIEVNSTGIYVSGQNEDDDYPTYFATAGAFKGQVGNGDLFLSKFDLTGNRIWSTYFGSNGYDLINGSDNLTVLDNKIVITGSHYGASGNVSTPGAFLTTVPNNSANLTNMYFAEFDDNGNRQWASYYGGAGSNYYGEYINARFLSNGALILWGVTGSPTGIGTNGAAYPNMTNPYPSSPFGFIAKFSSNRELSTSDDIIINRDLKLYDNPNNGNFAVSGSILEKQKTSLSIFDMSGKLVYKAPFEKKKTNHINLQGRLTIGNYLLEVRSENGERIKVFKMAVKY